MSKSQTIQAVDNERAELIAQIITLEKDHIVAEKVVNRVLLRSYTLYTQLKNARERLERLDEARALIEK
jgi:hypothetical protein